MNTNDWQEEVDAFQHENNQREISKISNQEVLWSGLSDWLEICTLEVENEI